MSEIEQTFEVFENGNASINAALATPDEFHVRTSMGAGFIILYASTDELRSLRDKITTLIETS